MANRPILSEDLLTGAKAIGNFIGASERRANYLLEKGNLPAFKHGKRWCARKSTLVKFFEKLEGGEAA